MAVVALLGTALGQDTRQYRSDERTRVATFASAACAKKVTGHLCSVTYTEAAEIGIDNLEHGFFANTELDPDKKPDTCTRSGGDYTLEHMVPGSPEADRLIATLIRHHVAITSTLPGTASAAPIDASVDGRRPLRAVLETMAPSVREA